MSLLVLFGVLIERLVFLVPATDLRAITFIVEFSLTAALFGLVILKKREMISSPGG